MPCEGLHSLGEREEGPIPSTATVSQCGVMATREKTSFQIFVVTIFILVSKPGWGPLGHSTETQSIWMVVYYHSEEIVSRCTHGSCQKVYGFL